MSKIFASLAPSLPYKESRDASATVEANSSLRKNRRSHSPCGSKMLLGECENGDAVIAKRILCFREWCPNCGQYMSKAHMRRFSSFLPKFEQISTMGVFEIEFPIEDRNKKKLRTKSGLRKTTEAIRDVIVGRRCGRRGRINGFFDRAFSYIHWYGDYYGLINASTFNLDMLEEQNNKKDKAPYPYVDDFRTLINEWVMCGGRNLVFNPNTKTIYRGAVPHQYQDRAFRQVARFATKYKFKVKQYDRIAANPHWNVVTDAGYISEEKLEDIKAALRKALHCPNLIVHYHYKTEPGQMVQALKYISRATFLDENWDYELANEIFQFRNVRWWGDWKQEKVWEADGDEFYKTIATVEAGKCPVCRHNIKWCHDLKPAANIDILQRQGKVLPLGADIYLLAIRPGDRLPLDDKDSGGNIKKQQSLNGEAEEIKIKGDMLKRRAAYFVALHTLGNNVSDLIKKKRHIRIYDKYWDDPYSEGFIEPDSEYPVNFNAG